MSIEDRLSAELTLVAGQLPTPQVEAPRLAHAGRRERARRRSILVGAAAAVLAAVTGSALLVVPLLDRDPDPVAPLGGPTDIPWTTDGVLHLPGRELEPPEESYAYAYFANGTILYTIDEGSELVLYHERPEGPLRLGQVSGQGVMVQLSGDGRYAVWKEGDGDAARIVAWDVGTGSELGRLEVEPLAHIYSVDNTGRVYYSTAGQTLVDLAWRPGSEPVALRLPKARAPSQGVFWPGGYSVDGRAGLPTIAYGTVDEGGRFTAVGQVPNWAGRWAPDGSAFAYKTGSKGDLMDDRVVVDHLDGTSVEMQLTHDPAIDLVEWESPDRLVVEVPTDDGYRWMRCDASSGECSEVTGGPTDAAGRPNLYSWEG